MKDRLPSQAISWLGILGGALTIVGNLEGVITLSNWARVLVTHWLDWMTSFWSGILAFVGLNAPSDFVLAWWTVSLFILTLSIGARLAGGHPGDVRALFRFSIGRKQAELLVLVFVLVGMLVMPTNSERPAGLGSVFLSAVPYTVAVTLAALITDTESLVKRMRLVVGVVLMTLALNWLAILVADWL